MATFQIIELTNTQPELAKQWQAFLNGHWTTQTPTKPGVYRIKGEFDGNHGIVFFQVLQYPDGRIYYPSSWGVYFGVNLCLLFLRVIVRK